MKTIKRITATKSEDLDLLLVVDIKDCLKDLKKALKEHLKDTWEDWGLEESLDVTVEPRDIDPLKVRDGKEYLYTWNGSELVEVCPQDGVQEILDENYAEQAEADMRSRQLTLEV